LDYERSIIIENDEWQKPAGNELTISLLFSLCSLYELLAAAARNPSSFCPSI
jgi:hypothetical protein